MKITICGSMSFAKEMLDMQSQLEALGHEVMLPIDTQILIKNPMACEDTEHCEKFDVTMDHFKKIENSDAILVVNYHKNGIDGYVGGSVLMEIGLAYYLGKKRFILYPLPHQDQQRYVAEVLHMKPILLGGDLALLV